MFYKTEQWIKLNCKKEEEEEKNSKIAEHLTMKYNYYSLYKVKQYNILEQWRLSKQECFI